MPSVLRISDCVILDMNLSPNERIAGVLAPLFALRTEDDLGVGDVAGLRQFIDWVAAIGFKLVQLLPINETGGDNSPYNAISSRAIDPTTLQLAPGRAGGFVGGSLRRSHRRDRSRRRCVAVA